MTSPIAVRAATIPIVALLLATPRMVHAQRYAAPEGKLRVALAKQPFSPTGVSVGPTTMANGGIQQLLTSMGATLRIDESKLTAQQDTEYGAWKRLG